MNVSIVDALADFASRTHLDDVPEEVVESARRSLTDTVACMLGGATVGPVQALAAALHDVAGPAPIVGTPYRSMPLESAFVGGIAGTWMDADSGGTRHPAGGRVPPVPTAHPPVHIVPALLAAISESGRFAGADVLRIYLVSYEVGARIGNATRLLPGIHPHGVHGTSSAALATGLVRGLDVPALSRAIELATAMPIVAALRVAMTGATVRNAFAGIGARNGMIAADRALHGDSAPPGAFSEVLEHGLSDVLDEERLLADLGGTWESSHAYIKMHACARWIHPALDAVEKLLAPDGIDADALEFVEVRTFRFAAMMNDPQPATDLGAKFSLPYCIAALIVFGRVELEAFTPTAMALPALRSVAGRVRIVADQAYTDALPERRPTTVTFKYRDGRIETASVDGSRGDPETMFTLHELEGKFLRLAAAAVGLEHAERALDALRRLRELPDAAALGDTLVA